MSTKVKGNNKGFSLVELIVVMAIMAILAVTLTPRLTQYIDKARQTNDREIPNAVFTAVRLGLLDQNIQEAVTATNADAASAYDWATGVDILSTFYARQDGATPSNPQLYTKIDSATSKPDLLANEVISTLGDNFKLQSNLAKDATNNTPELIVTISDVNSGKFTVSFEYDDDVVTGKYTMDTSAVGN